MKRNCIVIIFIVCCVMSVFAKADVTLKSGSLSKLKTSKAKVYVVWDYSHATLEGQDVKTFLKRKAKSGSVIISQNLNMQKQILWSASMIRQRV